MTREERERLRALADAATPGPWEVVCNDLRQHRFSQGIAAYPDGKRARRIVETNGGTWPPSHEDAAFIAAARAAVPALLDALDKAEERADAAEVIAKEETEHASDYLKRLAALRAQLVEVTRGRDDVRRERDLAWAERNASGERTAKARQQRDEARALVDRQALDLAAERGRVDQLEVALREIADAPKRSLWMDDRDDAANEIVDLARAALRGEVKPDGTVKP